MARPRSLPLTEIRAECKTLEAAVRARHLASEADLEAERPGSPANPDPGPRGWLRFYGTLRTWHERQAATAGPATADGGIEAAILRAVTERPETVTLSSLDEHGQPRVVQCYPKSHRALLVLHTRDVCYSAACREFRRLQEHGGPEHLALLERVAERMTEQLLQVVWAITHPGPWLPFDPWSTAETPPAWLSLLAPLDLVAILLGHKRVNHDQLDYLSQLVGGLTPPDLRPEPGLLGFGAWIVQISEATGVPLEVVERDRTLTAELARLWVRAKGHEAAKAAADAEARRR